METDLTYQRKAMDECERDIAFQALAGRDAEAYRAGFEAGVGRLLAILRDSRVFKPVLAYGSHDARMMTYQA